MDIMGIIILGFFAGMGTVTLFSLYKYIIKHNIL